MTPPTVLSAAASRTRSPAISSLMKMALDNPDLISLAAGFVDQGSLPVGPVRDAIARLLDDPGAGRRALQYGTTIGDPDLRARLLEYVERNERVPVGTFRAALPRTIVTTGSQQLLYLVAEALLDPGDIVLVESPTYFVFLGVLEPRGARAIGVEIDEGGLRLDRLDATLSDLEAHGALDRVKLIYTVTEHSNPTGISLAEERRGPLVELARRWSERGGQRIYVLEDAAYRGLTFAGLEPPSVWRHDTAGDTVILARTFSKTLSPGLKTGYAILPEPLVDPVLRLKGNHDFGSANCAQRLLERLVGGGDYERHIRRLTDLYRRKRDALLAGLEEHLGPIEAGASWTRPNGGLFLWLTLPEGVDTGLDGPFFARCVREGVIYVPGDCAFAGSPGPVPTNQARLCFGVPSESRLREGARRLASAVASCHDLVA